MSESESALASLEEQSPAKPIEDVRVPSGLVTEEVDLENVDLDSVVETVELEEILDYNEEDASAMTELVEQLSQPSAPDQVMLADVDESLLPETLETPGLDLYDQLPKKPVPPPPSETNGEVTIYESSEDNNVAQSADSAVESGVSGHRQRQVAIGISVLAAAVAIIGVGINDPFKWFSQPPQPITNSTPSEILEVTGIASGNPESAVLAINKMAAAGEQNKALNQILALGSIDDPTLLFSKGQLQWDLMNQDPSVDNTIGPAEAARSWQDALAAQPNWLDAQVALGFAYYEGGFWDEAIEAWENALDTGQEYDIPIVTLHEMPQDADIPNAPTKLHARLGLAMVYHQQSKQGLTDDDRLPLLAVAASYWQDVFETADNEDITDDLPFHWLWSEQALEDWQEAHLTIANYISQAAN